MWFPKKYHYNNFKFTIMIVDLKVSAASKVVAMSGCSKSSEYGCGTSYRFG